MPRPPQPVLTTAVDTPHGPLLCAVDEGGVLVRILFARAGVAEALEDLERQGFEPRAGAGLAGAGVAGADPTAPVRRQLEEYFEGRRRVFDLPLAVAGTPFQQAVWRRLQEIPYGEVRHYGDIAHALGRPSASRAVGAANGANPIPVVIPCHRVIGADGSLTGFGGGLEWKVALLEHEGVWPLSSASSVQGAQLTLPLGGTSPEA